MRVTGVELPGPLSKNPINGRLGRAAYCPICRGRHRRAVQPQSELAPDRRDQFGQLVLHPILVFVVLSFSLGLDNPSLPVGVLFAAAPMLWIYPILGSRFDAEQVCATALIVSTTMSFATFSFLIWILTSGAP